jgi:D-tyrosyl-tRNA(Tyr) deacylase
MIAVIQRVSFARVEVDSKIVGQIGPGLLVLLGISTNDDSPQSDFLVSKISQLRIFSDLEGKMNKSVLDLGLEVLVVSQFTLLADASQGNRPSYIKAARPEKAIPLYEYFCKSLEKRIEKPVQKGIFGADMKVHLLNDGPVTIVLDTDSIMKKKQIL